MCRRRSDIFRTDSGTCGLIEALQVSHEYSICGMDTIAVVKDGEELGMAPERTGMMFVVRRQIEEVSRQ